MKRQKRPDELAREAAPEPTEPLGTERTTIGVVKWWRDTKGHGVIAATEIAPWDIWCHFSAIDGTGFKELEAGERVEVDYYRADQESFKYIAARVRRLDASSLTADTRLASYGTLAPGRPNHHQLAGLNGQWRQGTVRGWLDPAGWAASLGYPGLVLDAGGPVVDVHLFESLDLPAHWSRLDEFEGPQYRRVVTQVSTADGEVPAWIYVIAAEETPAD